MNDTHIEIKQQMGSRSIDVLVDGHKMPGLHRIELTFDAVGQSEARLFVHIDPVSVDAILESSTLTGCVVGEKTRYRLEEI